MEMSESTGVIHGDEQCRDMTRPDRPAQALRSMLAGRAQPGKEVEREVAHTRK